jgi:hypothetical protein
LSRFRPFALLAVLALLATAFAACGSSDRNNEDPQQVLDSATLEGVESGNLDLSLAIKSEGKEGGNLDVSVSGLFQSKDPKDLPQLDLTASAKGRAQGKDIAFEGGLTLLSDRAFINYQGTEYEVDPTSFGFVKSGFEQAQQQGSSKKGNPADVSACQEAASGFKVGDFGDELTNDGSADVDGTSTTKISGELNVAGAIDAILELAEDPACRTQLEVAGPLPIGELEEAKGELASAVKKAQVEVYVGDDDIIRRVAAELTVEPEGTKSEKVEVDLDLVLSGVNEEQEISAPGNAKPLEGLLQKLGINPIEVLESIGSGEGLGELLESVVGDDLPLGSLFGGVGGQQAYLECLKGAQTPADLQQCASMIQ